MDRRTLLTTAAAAPLVSLAPLSAATQADPALVAFRRWVEVAQARHSYLTGGPDWEDDPHAVALDEAEEEARHALVAAVTGADDPRARRLRGKALD